MTLAMDTRQVACPTIAAMSDASSLDVLTAADFRDVRGGKLRLSATAPVGAEVVCMDVELADVTEIKKSPASAFRSPFSVLFHGPLTPVLPQGIYHLEHERLGAVDLFLVPVGPVEPNAMAYEAVFG